MSAPPAKNAEMVLEMLLAGRSRHEICRALSLAPATVNHIARALIFEAGVGTTAELVTGILNGRIARLTEALVELDRRQGGDRRRPP